VRVVSWILARFGLVGEYGSDTKKPFWVKGFLGRLSIAKGVKIVVMLCLSDSLILYSKEWLGAGGTTGTTMFFTILIGR
jgi:hypothetical protein